MHMQYIKFIKNYICNKHVVKMYINIYWWLIKSLDSNSGSNNQDNCFEKWSILKM